MSRLHIVDPTGFVRPRERAAGNRDRPPANASDLTDPLQVGGPLPDAILQFCLRRQVPGLRCLVILDIGSRAEPLDDGAVCIVERYPAPQMPTIDTVACPQEAKFDLILLTAFERGVPAANAMLHIVRVDYRAPTPALRLRFG